MEKRKSRNNSDSRWGKFGVLFLLASFVLIFMYVAPGHSANPQIAGGGEHSIALKSDGTVWAWGNNWVGQLGDGTTSHRSTPVQVSGLSGVIAIAGGGYHSIALKSDGTVWAWGWNEYGQLGDGTTSHRSTPVQVSGLSGVIAIAGGGYHSIALKSDGTVWAWGNNWGWSAWRWNSSLDKAVTY